MTNDELRKRIINTANDLMNLIEYCGWDEEEFVDYIVNAVYTNDYIDEDIWLTE